MPKRNRRVSLTDQILGYLQKEGRITSTTIHGMFGVMNAPDVIYQLRNRGYQIKSVRKTGFRGSYMEYQLGQ